MTHWINIAIAAKLTKGDRQRELAALLAARTDTRQPVVCAATPRRFLSIRKLIKPNAAVTAMLQVLRRTLEISAEMDLPAQLMLSDHPKAGKHTNLYLSHHTIQNAAFDVLRNAGTTVRHFKAADLPGRTSFDPDGFAGWSSLARQKPDELPLPSVSQTEIDRYFQTARQSALTSNQSKYAQSTEQADLPEKYVFVALQTIGDMVQRNAWVPMLEMLAMVVDRFAGTDTVVVVKRHPKCRSRKVAAALAALDTNDGVKITQGSIRQILSGAQAVFTVNSGVGSESIVHQVPLYCFGAADYAPIAFQIRNRADLERTTNPIRFAQTPDQISRFYYYYRNIYQVVLTEGLDDRLRALITASQTR